MEVEKGPAARYSSDDASSEPNKSVDVASEKALLRKCDVRIIPILFVVNVLIFLDRVNIGNARLFGLEKDLHMNSKSNEFNVSLFVFFIPYVLLEVPSNILMTRWHLAPSLWLPALVFMAGLCVMCHGFVQDFAGLVACRVLLGTFEAGTLPAIVFLMGMYYKKYEIQKRFSVIFTSGLVAGAFGGLLAFALAKMAGTAGYAGWRWIFILEGVITMAAAVAAKFILPNWPSSETFLSAAEKELIGLRLKTDNGIAKMDRLDRQTIRLIASDWKIYVGALLYLSISVCSYSTSLFTPTILHELGYSPSESQVRSIPIWVFAAFIALSTSWLSDRLRHRGGFVLVGCLVAGIGYTMLICPGGEHGGLSPSVRYLALFIVAAGLFTAQPLIVMWLLVNLAGDYKRAIGSAFQIGFGNIGGIVASNIFITSQAPRFVMGYGVALGFVCVHAILATGFMAGLMHENRRRDRGERDYRLDLPTEDLNNLGDDHPTFRFSI